MRTAESAIDNCLKCSLCNSVCPVMGVNPEYPGPKRLGPELERMRREGVPTDTKWVEYCLGCHRCDLVCPNQVNVSEMIALAKAEHRQPLIRRMRDWWFARPGLLGRLMTILPAASNFALSLKPVRYGMSLMMQIGAQRKFPIYTRAARVSSAEASQKPRVVFFPGCFIRYNRPDLGAKVIHLLERCGLAAEMASTGCCGVPAVANGDAAEARARARDNVNLLSEQVDAGTQIITSCSSCGHMLKTGFGAALEDDDELAGAAQRVADSTFDLAEFLLAQSDAGNIDMNFQGADLHLAYHAPCHQKSQGMGRPWYHLMRQIPGVNVEDLDAGCCGMSGTYGFKQEKYSISMEVGRPLFQAIDAAHAQFVVTECATCQMQIEHGAHVQTIHPVEVLLQAMTERA
jgi:glycerol-3-phosphate dehydrogenase subunit C